LLIFWHFDGINRFAALRSAAATRAELPARERETAEKVNAAITSDRSGARRLKPLKLMPRWRRDSGLADRDDDVGSAELQRRLSNFLAASAERSGGSNDRGNHDNAFQTLHGLLSSG
jgi:hypothetical protein